MKKLLLCAAILLTALSGFAQGVKIQAFTTNSGPVVTNIVVSLSSNLQPNRLRATNTLTGAVRIWAATSGTNGYWLDPATITPGAATNVAWPVQGSNTVLTTNGFQVTINAITDTNVVSLLASNVGGDFIRSNSGTGFNTILTNQVASTNAAGTQPALKVNGELHLYGNLIGQGASDISAQSFSGGSFSGSGSGLAGLQADNISGGTLHPARMATNAPFSNSWLRATSGSTAEFSRDGSGLTNISSSGGSGNFSGAFTGNAAGLTNLPGPFNSVVVDVTHGNDTIGNPFKTINAAQAAMSSSGSNYCLIRKGTYTAGTLYKTNCIFEMEAGAVLATTTAIAITNGTLTLKGSEFTEVRADTWQMTNATFVANGIDLFALNSGKTDGQFYGTNTIQLKNCYVIYTGVDGLTNGLVEIIDADIVAQIGVVQTSNTVVDVSCDRVDGFGVANVLDAQGGAKVYIRANIADVRNEIQISPNLKATQCFLTANVFTWNYNETCYHNGGVTPNTDLSDINTDPGEWQNQRCNIGFWTLDETITIPVPPPTRYYDSLGF